MTRDYDIALFGATGFVGELTADYLVAHAPPHARLAIAGRNAAKLDALKSRLGRPELGVLVADVEDAASIAALAQAARAVISTVGPYLHYGEPLVAACAAAGTDYVDLTGEPEFVDLMYLRYHAVARESGARLVHSCGFDSIPYDLGALFTISQLADDVPIALRGFGMARGSISGGTFHSAVHVMGRLKEAGRVSRQRQSVERHAEDGRPAEGRSVRGVAGRPHNEPLAGGWVLPAPTIDPQHVLRSARLDPAYGPDFSYSHFLVTKRLGATVALVAGIGTVAMLAQLVPTRRVLLKLKAPGTGPSAERRAKSFFKVRMVADYRSGAGSAGSGSAGSGSGSSGSGSGSSGSGSGSSGSGSGSSGSGSGSSGSGSGGPRERLITEVRGGDPGYDETAKMLAESALALAFDEGLPDRGGGQWTPALALGQPLIDRLVRAGIVFEVVESAGGDAARPAAADVDM